MEDQDQGLGLRVLRSRSKLFIIFIIIFFLTSFPYGNSEQGDPDGATGRVMILGGGSSDRSPVNLEDFKIALY
ncbi:hypothetical protein BDV29DRAFT_175813 [Aspergillus leporis]|uniref:Uncharacterized protein n=1 Tax=Aspergillus leporis TaxID=41062 RepID=A0A5N5WY83_9EURO|nr:hypothetical protein BDV29DRAFT_175813 [Aspergillus leporis]